MTELEIGFIGFGLIGGSIARGIRHRPPDGGAPLLKNARLTITVYDYHIKKDGAGYENQDLAQARADGAIDRVTGELKALSSCDILFLCAPVQSNLAYLSELSAIIQPGCMITDVGSVKGNIQAHAEALGLSKNFLGGHPMAGSEQTGYGSASDYLLENAYYILTPSADTPAHFIDRMTQIIRQLGAIPVILDAKEHDDITAAISHVPHIIAALLVNLVKEGDGSQKMRMLAAGGFKDITRIASSSPVMWRDICLSNPESILDFLSRYRRSIEALEAAIRTGDRKALLRTFETSKEYRDSIPSRSGGLIAKACELFVDIRDRAGAIAAVAVLLAEHGINIKNIGILRNREFREGVLRIELADETAISAAKALLLADGYTVYD